ncbi:hypothetical protein CDQ92_13070 [Sphingopyxis bauzanensis]|uniref:Uncharacterized protein n=1 Tax=Sphingopyxis bauzanensis TaxID=651663 RepID=A0A246JRQ5_9SPHN|nr:hypothetical protein [Sphingopyxis bauzanensis]OWQ95711.1 hypothetical protein CDQ92_13070 [Sphingopyxis bauzanensis]GGJ39370.1 hypothetical protein GCM10011393_06980 [Sphingopyxis bauzanensis]
MNDLHALAAFQALDERRLQPVDKEAVAPEIAACPFGHPFVAKYSRSAVQRVVWARGFADRYKVMCECGAEGPYGDTQKAALAAWNARQSETGAALTRDGRGVLDGWKMGASDETGPWATSPSQITVSDHMLKSTEALAERVAAMRFTKTISGDPWESDTTVDQIEPNALANTVGPILKAFREMLAALAQPVEAGEDGA